MMDRVPEADWKRFRPLRERTLDRFCEGVLDEVVAEVGSDGSSHERYLRVYDLVRKRDRELDQVFDSPSRSRMILGLMALRARGLVRPEELDGFSAETLRATDPERR